MKRCVGINYDVINHLSLNIGGRVFAYCNPRRWGPRDLGYYIYNFST